MSNRKRQTDKPVILGPDGKPYTPPAKKPESVRVEADGVDVSDSVYSFSLDISRYFGSESPYRITFGHEPKRSRKPARETLASTVARQIGALTKDFDGASIAELPKPPRDLHTYADAFASARENCTHNNVESTMYAKGERYCHDCRRYISDAEYRKHHSSWFGL